jgi:hypothetical protein
MAHAKTQERPRLRGLRLNDTAVADRSIKNLRLAGAECLADVEKLGTMGRLSALTASKIHQSFHAECQLCGSVVNECYRPIPANRTAGEFVIAPQSISWLNDINDCIEGVIWLPIL